MIVKSSFFLYAICISVICFAQDSIRHYRTFPDCTDYIESGFEPHNSIQIQYPQSFRDALLYPDYVRTLFLDLDGRHGNLSLDELLSLDRDVLRQKNSDNWLNEKGVLEFVEKHLHKFKNLHSIRLMITSDRDHTYHYQVTEAVLRKAKKLKKLEFLSVSISTQKELEHISKFKNLKFLVIKSDYIDIEVAAKLYVPTQFKNFKQLKVFILDVRLNSQSITNIYGLKKLEVLATFAKIPKGVHHLKNLRCLSIDIDETQFLDSLLPEIEKMNLVQFWNRTGHFSYAPIAVLEDDSVLCKTYIDKIIPYAKYIDLAPNCNNKHLYTVSSDKWNKKEWNIYKREQILARPIPPWELFRYFQLTKLINDFK